MPAIDIIWKAKSKTQTLPLIGDQYVAMGTQVLCLRNPLPADSAFMGKMYAVTAIGLPLFFTYMMWSSIVTDDDGIWLLVFALIGGFWVAPFLAWRIYLIRTQSNFVFNRHTQRIYYRRRKHLYVGNWSDVQAGMIAKTEWSGASINTSYGLLLNAFDNTPDDPDNPDTLYNKTVAVPVRSIVIDSNEPSDPRVDYVGQVWAYIQHFMEHGPDGLPVPNEPHWWHVPHNQICLTPAQAWRHYAPWRSGEPGEAQGKKWWLLPFWLVTFPYNLFAALCWWVTCTLFRVRPMGLPLEAMEGETAVPATLDMASKGVRP